MAKRKDPDALSGSLSVADHIRDHILADPDNEQNRVKINGFWFTLASLQPVGRPKTRLAQGQFAKEHGLEAAMAKYNITKRTAVDCLGEWNSHQKKQQTP